MGINASSRKEIEDCIKDTIKIFTKEYIKWTAIFMVEKFKMEAKATTWPFLLDQRPDAIRETHKTGWLMKEGAVRKNWKKRYFIVKPDYSVEYYEKEEDAALPKPKPKGTMTLQGYWVNTNPNGELIKRLENVAKKMGINTDDIPKPKEYPPFTLEIHHWRRRSYYITCENQEEFNAWTRMFQECCWENKGLKNQEWVHVQAFNKSVWETRWQLDRWGWWSYGGNEEQILSDLIADQVEWAVMGPIWCKLSGPYIIRNQISKKIQSAIDTAVGAAVKPAWTAMAKAAEELKPVIEPVLKDVGTALGETENKIKQAIKDAILPIVNPPMDEHVKPHVEKILGLLKDPMETAFAGSIEVWEKMSSDYEKEVKKDKEGFKSYTYPVNKPLYYTWTAKDQLQECYDPLWLLNIIFPQIWPWSVIYEGKRHIDKGIDSACWSYYNRMNEKFEGDETAVDKHHTEIRGEISTQLKEDAKIWKMLWYNKALKLIIMPALMKIINPLTSAALTPIESMIPDPMKQLLNIKSLFDEIINELVDGIINPLFGFTIQPVPLTKKEKKELVPADE